MSSFEPNKEHLRHVLLYLFNQKKNASESRRILVETYGDNVLTQDACVRWFRRFKSGDFDLKDKERPGQPKKFQDAELQALLDEDDTQTQQQMAERLNVDRRTISDRLYVMEKFQEAGKWKPHVKVSDSKNATSNGNQSSRKRKLRASESDTEPENQNAVNKLDIFTKHIALKLREMPLYNALQCQEKIETLINDELLIVQSHQEEIETVLIKQEPGISEEICDDNTQTIFKQEPLSPLNSYSIKTENISDSELP